jgi:hypothetical protein
MTYYIAFGRLNFYHRNNGRGSRCTVAASVSLIQLVVLGGCYCIYSPDAAGGWSSLSYIDLEKEAEEEEKEKEGKG